MYDDAISVIRGVMYKTSGITQNIFYYRLYEVYLCQGRNDESVSVIYNIYIERNISDIYSRTQYIQVSKKISSEFNFDLIEIPSNWNERLSNNLDFVLNSI